MFHGCINLSHCLIKINRLMRTSKGAIKVILFFYDRLRHIELRQMFSCCFTKCSTIQLLSRDRLTYYPFYFFKINFYIESRPLCEMNVSHFMSSIYSFCWLSTPNSLEWVFRRYHVRSIAVSNIPMEILISRFSTKAFFMFLS